MFKLFIKSFFFLLILIQSSMSAAANLVGTEVLSSINQVPVQQFVTSEPEEVAPATGSGVAQTPETLLAPALANPSSLASAAASPSPPEGTSVTLPSTPLQPAVTPSPPVLPQGTLATTPDPISFTSPAYLESKAEENMINKQQQRTNLPLPPPPASQPPLVPLSQLPLPAGQQVSSAALVPPNVLITRPSISPPIPAALVPVSADANIPRIVTTGDPISSTAPQFYYTPTDKNSEFIAGPFTQTYSITSVNPNAPVVGGTVPQSYSRTTSSPKLLPKNQFEGSIQQGNFIRCEKFVSTSCNRTQDSRQFQVCLNRLEAQPACQQFLAFAKAIDLRVRDDIDVIQYYDAAHLDMIHVSRWGANYPGEYYALGVNGDLVNITFGPQTQALNITTNVYYPEIVQRFPSVSIWSALVEQPPQVETAPDGYGLRFIFRYPLLNGCHACERAGYANVAYDFSQEGTLKHTQVISLEPLR